MTWHQRVFRRTHDLGDGGARLGCAIDPRRLRSWNRPTFLSDYASKLRYPGRPTTPRTEKLEASSGLAGRTFLEVNRGFRGNPGFKRPWPATIMNAPEALELKSGLQTRCEWQWRLPPSRRLSSTASKLMRRKWRIGFSILSSCVRRASLNLRSQTRSEVQGCSRYRYRQRAYQGAHGRKEQGAIVASHHSTPADLDGFLPALQDAFAGCSRPPRSPPGWASAAKASSTPTAPASKSCRTPAFFQGLRLADLVGLPLDVPVFADNDARVALAGEMVWAPLAAIATS